MGDMPEWYAFELAYPRLWCLQLFDYNIAPGVRA